jgi:hypothetical protein
VSLAVTVFDDDSSEEEGAGKAGNLSPVLTPQTATKRD